MNSTEQTKQTKLTTGAHVHHSNHFLWRWELNETLPSHANTYGEVIDCCLTRAGHLFTVKWGDGTTVPNMHPEDLCLVDTCTCPHKMDPAYGRNSERCEAAYEVWSARHA